MARVTLKDVAARAGVSYQTVSKVLNRQIQVAPETAERISRAARDLNYEPDLGARSLRLQASQLIGYAWHHSPESSFHPVLDKFVHVVANAAKEQNFHLLTFVVDQPLDGVTPYAELYSRNQVAGFILADTVKEDPRIAFLMARKIPFTSFGRTSDEWDHCWVDVDGEYGIRLTVEHLLGRGHRRIALATWPAGSLSGHHRNQGYRAALEEAGIAEEPAWITRGSNSAETGAKAISALLDIPREARPTALVCISDVIAIGAINAAAAAGLVVGGDIAITGFDDVPMAEYLHPPLTSVCQPIQAVGEYTIDLLLKQIRGEPIENKRILLRPELVVRESSGGL